MRWTLPCMVAGTVVLACSWFASSALTQNTQNNHPIYAPAQDQGPKARDGRGSPAAAEVDELKKAPTPRAKDGHPDLTGFWNRAGWGYGVFQGRFSADGKTYDIGNHLCVTCGGGRPSTAPPPPPPPYKPEFADKAKEMSDHWMKYDPVFHCGMSGFPRLGPPTEIVQTPDRLVFLYQPLEQLNSYRVIPIDGRGHDPSLDPSYLGDSVGHWDGDTMVIDVVNFTDETWISRQAPIHTDQMHVVETLKREGNTIQWKVVIDDPKVLTAPIVQTQTMGIGEKGGHALEELPCHEHDAAHIPVQ